MGQDCNGECKDLASDDKNCGVCEQVCVETAGLHGCLNGACKYWSWAAWRMPNPASSGLPNPSDYEIDGVNGVVTDKKTGLMWQRNVDVNTYTWSDAKNYCASLVYGGYNDWRLPSRIELVSLVDFTRINPALDTNAFPPVPSSYFWTSSPYANASNFAWAVSSYYGRPYYYNNTTAYRVRCVR